MHQTDKTIEHNTTQQPVYSWENSFEFSIILLLNISVNVIVIMCLWIGGKKREINKFM